MTSALSSALSSSMFQQTLQDMVKLIRLHRRDEEAFMRSKVEQCTEEARNSDPAVKATALLKLTYLQMFGYSFSSSSFQILEVISRPDYVLKRIGYLAAAQSISPTTDVLLLATNQFYKDLVKGRQADCSLALTCLAKICTEEFGKDLSQHVYELLKSSRPYIRKKAILAMYKISLVYPEVLVTLLPKLLEALSDDYLSVVCAAVTVLCELARRSPKDVAMFGPPLINLLEDSRNNWIRIKVVKLLGWLCREKPALAESLVNPISKLMNKTEAKSLMYECCNTITVGMTKYYSVVELAAGKLGEFITDSDQNLVVLGLLALTRLGKTYPNVIQKHRDMVLNCFEDEDVGIRSCALDLITCFIKKNNFREVSKILRRKLSKALEDPKRSVSGVLDIEGDFLLAVAQRVLDIGVFKQKTPDSPGGYQFLSTESDFAWYIENVLFGLLETLVRTFANQPSVHFTTTVVKEIADQLIEIPARVVAIRELAVDYCLRILVLVKDFEADELANLTSAAAFVIGENAGIVPDKPTAVKEILTLKTCRKDEPTTRLRVMYACLKLVAAAATANDQPMTEILANLCREGFKPNLTSQDAEVQERASEAIILLEKGFPLNSFTSGVMRPQDGSAQRRVVPPKGLDLNASLSTVFDEADDEEEDVDDGSGEDGLYRGKGAGLATEDMTITAKEKDEVRALSAKIFGQMEVDENGRDGGKDGKGKPKRENTLFYLGDDTPSKSKENKSIDILLDFDDGNAKSEPMTRAPDGLAPVDVFVGEDDGMPTKYDKDDYAVLGTAHAGGLPSKDTLLEGMEPTGAGKAGKKSKKTDKKKKKRKKAGGGEKQREEELLIDFEDDKAKEIITDGRKKKEEIEDKTKKTDVLDLLT